MRYNEICEARRNRVDNPKTDPVEVIADYLGQRDLYYMSYTVIEKLGINPRSTYNTPIGIYAYPINHKIAGNIVSTANLRGVPYMGDAPYIWIFKPKSVGSGLILSDYDSTDYDNDVNKLSKFVNTSEMVKNPAIIRLFDNIEARAKADARVNRAGGHIWNLTRVLALVISGTESVAEHADMLLNIGASVTEVNKTEVAKIIDVYSDSSEYEIEYPDGSTFVVGFDEVEPVDNFNEHAVIVEYGASTVSARRSVVLWTYLLHRVLGYDYVDDSSGLSIIHANEPSQAVFFGKNVIDVYEKLLNPSGDDYSGTDTIGKLYSASKSPDAVERIDPKISERLFSDLLKFGLLSFSSNIPAKFMGHIVINSSKLQARLLLADSGMIDYFKSIHPHTFEHMDNYIINKIYALPRDGNVEYKKDIAPILNYMKKFRVGRWPEGERAILNQAYSSNNTVLLLEYMQYIRKSPWPDAEFIILKNPASIPTYAATVLRKRWPEGERVLQKLDAQRGAWILELYADEFKINITDIGKI